MQKFEHGGNVYDKSPTGRPWLDFSANINPLGLPKSVKQVLQNSIDDVIHYPDPKASELKAAIAEHYGVARENIVLGNGAAELFYLFLQMVRPKHVLIPVPSFSEYERAAKAADCQVTYFPLDSAKNFCMDWQKLFKSALESADCVILGNPNNPTGNLLTRQEILTFLTALEEKSKSLWVIMDESFLDFIDDAPYTLRNLADTYAHVFVVQSLTKFYAIPGLRLGFGVANTKLIQHLEQGKDVWNVNLLAQKAGVAALNDIAYQQASRKLVKKEKQWLYRNLQKLEGIVAYKPSVNFIFLNIRGTGRTSTELVAQMREHGILLRDCANYPGLDGKSFVRVAVRTHEENILLIKALEECLQHD